MLSSIGMLQAEGVKYPHTFPFTDPSLSSVLHQKCRHDFSTIFNKSISFTLLMYGTLLNRLFVLTLFHHILRQYYRYRTVGKACGARRSRRNSDVIYGTVGTCIRWAMWRVVTAAGRGRGPRCPVSWYSGWRLQIVIAANDAHPVVANGWISKTLEQKNEHALETHANYEDCLEQSN